MERKVKTSVTVVRRVFNSPPIASNRKRLCSCQTVNASTVEMMMEVMTRIVVIIKAMVHDE